VRWSTDIIAEISLISYHSVMDRPEAEDALEATGLCIKHDNHILYQSPVCEEICGDVINTECMKCNDNDTDSDFISEVDGHLCHFHRFEDSPNKKLTVIKSKNKEYKDILNQLSHSTLTDREKEIALLLFKQKTNAEIIESLLISKATLKTHINHIYKKIPSLKNLR